MSAFPRGPDTEDNSNTDPVRIIGIVGRDVLPEFSYGLPDGTVIKWTQQYGIVVAVRHSEEPVPKKFWPQVDTYDYTKSFFYAVDARDYPEGEVEFHTRYVTTMHDDPAAYPDEA
jgi:hypothetical protein